LLGSWPRLPQQWSRSFFKLRLGFWIGFGMDGPGNRFAPPMPFEQPRDRTFVDLVADLAFKSAFDFVRCRNLPALGSREKGGEERLLFFPGHRLAATTSFASCLNRHHSQAIVAGNHPVNQRHGGAGMFGN